MASRSNKMVRYTQPAMPMSSPKPSPITSAVRSAVASRKPMQQSSSLVKPIAQQVMQRRQPMKPAIGTDKNGNRLGPRPQVGEADAATRRRMLDQQLKPGPAVKPAAAPVVPRESLTSPGGGMGNQARRKVIDDTVDRMSR